MPPAFGEDTATILPIHLPALGGSGDPSIGGLASGVASPVTRHDDRLLDGLSWGSPIEVGMSRAPGSSRTSSRCTPMSLDSPVLPGAGCRGVLKCLVESAHSATPFTNVMRCMQQGAKRKLQEEEESPYPTAPEDDADWM